MKRFIWPLLACFIGVVVLIAFFPRANPDAQWGFVFDRAQAVQRAREVAAQQGVPVDGWQVRLSAKIDRRLEAYRLRHPEDTAAQRISPVAIKVLFSAPKIERQFLVDLFPDARVAGWDQKVSGHRPLRRTPPEMALAKASQAFQVLTGPDSGAFRLTTEGAQSKEGLRFTWEPGMSNGGFQPTVDVIVSHGEVLHAETHTSYSKAVEDEYVRLQSVANVSRIGFPVLLFLMISGASILYTLGATRKKLDHRLALLFGAVSILAIVAGFFAGPGFEDLRISELMDEKDASSLWVGISFALVGSGLMAWVVFGGGLSSAGATVGKWWSLRLLFSPRMLTRPVGRSLCAGILWAPVMACTQLIAALFYPRVPWYGRDPAELISRFPLLPPSLDFPFHPTLIGFFGIVLAFALTRIASRWLRGLYLLVTSLVFFIGYGNVFRDSWQAMVLNGIVLMAAMFGIYRMFDLLALVVAETAKNILFAAAVLLCQPSHALQASGWRGVAILSTALIAGWALILKRPDAVSEEDAATVPLAEGIHAKRDELKSEFNIAQRAQRDMLPESAPPVPGFTLSAHCTPARDVGGDLYDFLPLSAGRLGIAVADVSGKGVPAALYMTLTKGLLAATTQEDLELPAILEHINGHLYTVGRRKTFVTMALAILDPHSKTLEYARAGHNPVVWRKASDGSAAMVNARGMGLGITGGKVFARTLAVETLQLEPGDFVVFYSDGLTEAMNSALEQYGDDRLVESVARLGSLNAAGARDAILRDVTDFLNGTHPQDDLTLVVLKFD